MNNIDDFYDLLIEKIPEHVLSFCLYNDPDFGAIPAVGTISKEHGKYYFNGKEKKLQIKNELPLSDPEQRSMYDLMIRYPKNMYAGIVRYGDETSMILLFNKKNGYIELMENFYYYYFQYRQITTYSSFIKRLKICIEYHNKEYPYDKITISELFPNRHDFDYI